MKSVPNLRLRLKMKWHLTFSLDLGIVVQGFGVHLGNSPPNTRWVLRVGKCSQMPSISQKLQGVGSSSSSLCRNPDLLLACGTLESFPPVTQVQALAPRLVVPLTSEVGRAHVSVRTLLWVVNRSDHKTDEIGVCEPRNLVAIAFFFWVKMCSKLELIGGYLECSRVKSTHSRYSDSGNKVDTTTWDISCCFTCDVP